MDGRSGVARAGSALASRRITLRQIDGFLAAAELLSFTRAAQQLHMTQPAFSQLIREIEGGLGVRLFDRTTRRVNLTASGEALHRKMKRGVLEIFDACEEARAIERVEQGHLAVGTLQSLAVGLVTQSLGDLRSESPGVTVSLHEDYNGALVERVAQGDIDFAVCAFTQAVRKMSFHDLFQEELVAVMLSSNPLAKRRAWRWTALENQPLILTTLRSSTREQISEALAANGIAVRNAYEVASMFTALSMVRAGFGITMIPRTVLPEVNMIGLTSVRLLKPTPLRQIGICRRTDRTPSPAALRFEKLLRKRAAGRIA